MKATFRTLCGCERHISIPFPPQKEYLLPLMPYTVAAAVESEAGIFVKTRKFLLVCSGGDPVNGFAEYREADTP